MPPGSGCGHWASDGATGRNEVWEDEAEGTSQASKEIRVLGGTYYQRWKQDIMGIQRSSN